MGGEELAREREEEEEEGRGRLGEVGERLRLKEEAGGMERTVGEVGARV